MDIEYEATFPNIEKDFVRKNLKSVGAKLIKPEFLQRRVTFNFPEGHELEGGWVRVRDESDRITMSIKVVNGSRIEDQKEVCLIIDNFENAKVFLETLGCIPKAYQETKREIWTLDNVEIAIDEWPFLEPFVEIEGTSEAAVKNVAEKIGFDYNKALFCAVAKLYNMKYNLSEDQINNHTPRIVFGEENPFL